MDKVNEKWGVTAWSWLPADTELATGSTCWEFSSEENAKAFVAELDTYEYDSVEINQLDTDE